MSEDDKSSQTYTNIGQTPSLSGFYPWNIYQYEFRDNRCDMNQRTGKYTNYKSR